MKPTHRVFVSMLDDKGNGISLPFRAKIVGIQTRGEGISAAGKICYMLPVPQKIEHQEGDFCITIDTTRCHCINLVGGENGPKKTERNSHYECELLNNESGICKPENCPLI